MAIWNRGTLTLAKGLTGLTVSQPVGARSMSQVREESSRDMNRTWPSFDNSDNEAKKNRIRLDPSNETSGSIKESVDSVKDREIRNASVDATTSKTIGEESLDGGSDQRLYGTANKQTLNLTETTSSHLYCGNDKSSSDKSISGQPTMSDKLSRRRFDSTSSSHLHPQHPLRGSSDQLSYNDLNVSSYQNIKSFSDLPYHFGYNQHIVIDREIREQLRQVLWKFGAPIRYAFAYGSGVFSQGTKAANTTVSKPQIDMIFGVTHTEHWHSLNLKQNSHHYSGLRWLGSGAISFVQDQLGAGLYFNPYVEMDGMKIKYGVVNMDTLRKDLKSWNTLYVAGRLHKPVKILRDEPQIRFMNQTNLISVLRASLLLLPEKFTELDLYKTIAGISYMGDFRMSFGENPNKVSNIVENQFLNFRRLYSPLMDSLPNLDLLSYSESSLRLGKDDVTVACLQQDMSPQRRGNMVIRLPREFRDGLYSRYIQKFRDLPQLRIFDGNALIGDDPVRQCTEFDIRIASDPELSKEVARAIRHTVGWPSISQSAKGILTAGLSKGVRYSSEKLKKYYHGKSEKEKKSS